MVGKTPMFGTHHVRAEETCRDVSSWTRDIECRPVAARSRHQRRTWERIEHWGGL